MGFFFPIREQLSRQNLCLKQIIKKTNKTATTTKPRKCTEVETIFEIYLSILFF